MLKQHVENKADSFTGTMTGKRVLRSDLEDPQRPGHLREGLLLVPDEWSAAQHFGLRSPSGRSIGFIHPTADPREPRREEAPANLLQAVAQAQAALDAHHRKSLAAVDAMHAAQVEQQRAARRDDKRAYTAAVAGEHAAREEHRSLCEEERPLVKRLADGEEKVRAWLWDERLRRHGRAEEPSPSVF